MTALLVGLGGRSWYLATHPAQIPVSAAPAEPSPARSSPGRAAATPAAVPPERARPIPDPAVSAPSRLRIPRISVDAAVEAVGVDPHGDMGVPTRSDDVGWYQPGVRPGQPGDAVIDGHLDWTTGPAVFWQLKELQPGDEIFVVPAGGPNLRYVVSKTFSVPYTARPSSFGLFSQSGAPMLSLITCDGAWDAANNVYRQRLVVDADLSGTAT